MRLLSSSIDYILKSKDLVVHFYNMVKAFLSVLCLTFIWKFRLLVLQLLLLLNPWFIIEMWRAYFMYYLVDIVQNWLNWFHFLFLDRSLLVILTDFSVTIPTCYKDAYVNSIFPRTAARLWTSLPIECFPLTYDLSCFKSRINRYLLTLGYF